MLSSILFGIPFPAIYYLAFQTKRARTYDDFLVMIYCSLFFQKVIFWASAQLWRLPSSRVCKAQCSRFGRGTLLNSLRFLFTIPAYGWADTSALIAFCHEYKFLQSP